MLDALSTWLQSTALSQAILSNTWIWPAAETLHFVGLALVLGIIGLLDTRLMGLARAIPVTALRDLVPFAMAGFAINVATGLIFLIGQPGQYVHNVAWWFKAGFLAVCGLNAAVFEWFVWPHARERLERDADPPLAAKLVGAVSLLSWLGVLYWGRMLPFIGDAF